METPIGGSRNKPRGDCERAQAGSAGEKYREAHTKNYASRRSRNSVCTAGIENAVVVTKRGRGQEVEGAIGIGPHQMDADAIIRGLVRLGRKSPRTATVREMAGVRVVLCPGIPVGMWAVRTPAGVKAFSLETGAHLFTVPYASAEPLTGLTVPPAVAAQINSAADGQQQQGAG